MKKDPLIFVKHILESIDALEDFSKDVSKTELMKDRLRQNAVIRELEVIGEAVKNLSNDFRDKYPSIEWSKIAGMRDKLIHHYFGVDLDTVWDVLKEDMPKLKKEIKEIIEKG